MKHAAARYPGLIAVALLAAAGALSARAQAPAAAPLRIAQAPAQGQGPATVDRARLEARLAAVGVLIDQSSAARQIESSGDSRAIDLRNRARETYLQAGAAFRAGDLERASRLLPQASARMFEAVRLAAPEQVTADKLRSDFEARLESVRSLHAAQRRIAAEKPGTPGAREAAASVERLTVEARELAAADRIQEARQRLDQAYYVAKAAIGSMRGGDTLVRSLQFATREEEFRYELDRNDTHRMLIRMLLDDRRTNASVDAMVRRSLDRAAQLREQADDASSKGEFQGAVKLLEESTGELVRAIRGAGVFIPG